MDRQPPGRLRGLADGRVIAREHQAGWRLHLERLRRHVEATPAG